MQRRSVFSLIPVPTGRVNQLPIGLEVTKQQCAEVRPRSFGVRPADDDELGPVEAFGLHPTRPGRPAGKVSRTLGDDPFEPMLARRRPEGPGRRLLAYAPHLGQDFLRDGEGLGCASSRPPQKVREGQAKTPYRSMGRIIPHLEPNGLFCREFPCFFPGHHWVDFPLIPAIQGFPGAHRSM